MKRFLEKRKDKELKLTILILSVLLVMHLVSCNSIRALGKNPAGAALSKIQMLPNYKNGQFQNLDQNIPQPAFIPQKKNSKWKLLLKFLSGQSQSVLPTKPLIAFDTDLKHTIFDKPTIIWFGHSSFLLKSGSVNILFDPSFSGFAGPFKGAIRAFEGSNVYDHNDMPVIDALVISHDHYDHLDYITVKKLRKKVKRVIVPIGVGSHFIRWGYPKEVITELNWNESFQVSQDILITATPAHHRSNRTFVSKKTLWASYVIKVLGYKIFSSGDSGYSKHFKIIGQKYGPFDLALLECGQYNIKWPNSHMFPTQTAQAALDLGASVTIPVHWGKYAESEHAWNEPVNLFLKAADSMKVKAAVPGIGEPYTIGSTIETFDWWNYF